MKILIYATPDEKGHHLSYLKAIVYGLKEEHEIVAVLPKKIVALECSQRIIKDIDWGTRKFLEYNRLMKEFHKIVRKEKPDYIHIQCGDNFYRFFGIGLSKLKKYNIVVTFHHMRRSLLRDISMRRIFSIVKCGVVHTSTLKQMLNQMGIDNVSHIEYPSFNEYPSYSGIEARKNLGIASNDPILLALGATREDKGLDVLLEALKKVSNPFVLLVAGKEDAIKKQQIIEMSKDYINKPILILRFLTDDEFNQCIAASDYIVLPYKKHFDGASGPLGEGVTHNKVIIGPKHGSLGQIIEGNHLGFTFESENSDDLAIVIEKALSTEFVHDEKYIGYKMSLDPCLFISKYRKIFN